MDQLDDNELVDYEETEELLVNGNGEEKEVEAESKETEDGVKGKGGHVGIATTGFRDFLLKPELLRSILDAGFEAPSGGRFLFWCTVNTYVYCVLIFFFFF